MREVSEMGKSTLLKLAEINKPVSRFQLYVLTRFRWSSTYVAYLIMFMLAAIVLSALTEDLSLIFLYVLESLLISGLCTMATVGYLKRHWLQRSPLTTQDIQSLISYGEYVVQTYGKHANWQTLCAAAGHPEPRVYGTSETPRFERDYPMEYVLGGILCAMIKEGGWSSIPQEAVNAMYNYPRIYKPFYHRY